MRHAARPVHPIGSVAILCATCICASSPVGPPRRRRVVSIMPVSWQCDSDSPGWHRVDEMVTPGPALCTRICSAHCKSSTQSVASHNTRSSCNLSMARVQKNSGDSTGVPKILTPLGLHTSSPRSATPGGHTPALRSKPLPSCRCVPAILCTSV